MAALVPGLETGCASRADPFRRARDGLRWARGPYVRQLGPRDLATGERLKASCIRTPGHPPPHDVLDPFARIAG
jgi:hypothetical protein